MKTTKPLGNLPDEVLGYIEIDTAGEIVSSYGDESDALSTVIPYFHQVADVMGESMGFDAFQEGLILGKSITAICLPKTDSTLGIICQSRANYSEVLTKVLEVTG
ncbi:MAG: hypothetical protein AAGA45_01445 [Verrucomicrobiota bacterium]